MAKFGEARFKIHISWVITISLVIVSWTLSHVIALVCSVEEVESASWLSIVAI